MTVTFAIGKTYIYMKFYVVSETSIKSGIKRLEEYKIEILLGREAFLHYLR